MTTAQAGKPKNNKRNTQQILHTGKAISTHKNSWEGDQVDTDWANNASLRLRLHRLHHTTLMKSLKTNENQKEKKQITSQKDKQKTQQRPAHRHFDSPNNDWQNRVRWHMTTSDQTGPKLVSIIITNNSTLWSKAEWEAKTKAGRRWSRLWSPWCRVQWGQPAAAAAKQQWPYKFTNKRRWYSIHQQTTTNEHAEQPEPMNFNLHWHMTKNQKVVTVSSNTNFIRSHVPSSANSCAQRSCKWNYSNYSSYSKIFRFQSDCGCFANC